MVDTLKTAVVVVLLLACLYGVYAFLNSPDKYPQDLAWETGAADPALQIELGTPEGGDANSVPAELAPPPASWGSTPRTYDPTTEPNASRSTEAAGTFEQDLARHHDHGDNHRLPVPGATTPAAPVIAAPDLLGNTHSPTAGDTLDSGVNYSASSPSNALRDPASGPNDFESPVNRSGGSNRYGGYATVPAEPSAAAGAGDNPLASSTSTQANINDVAAGGAARGGMNAFQATMQSVHTKIEAEAWQDALLKLSSFNNDPSLSADEMSQLVDFLDPLAGKVIYSREHLIEPAYQSQPGDTLKNIAERYEVPWQLLANINSIENPETLLAGRELKVVRGPFRAEVSLSKNELTLFVGKLYAGRFSINVGDDPAPLPGQYQVHDKQPGRTYYAGNGETIPIDDPNNPYGRVWLDLGSNLSIHGSSPNGLSPGQGCIALTARDAGDVFGILSKGSSIVIVR
ncbi:MAG: LysM peptidoglycan-binding domain-containing protein [Planctomycetota bacterium]|nr:LysM peptidoglycan-binding domain-containing protein [Planctomycetota bacterium]